MRIVFFGTPEFAADILSFLLDHKVSIVGVVTQPDRPKGRSSALVCSPVKKLVSQCAGAIPLFQPEKSSDPQFINHLQTLEAELYVVVAFGQILPQKLLDLPSLGCINIHASLLPKYRGAAPIQRCLIAGDKETGVCIQKMVRQLDAGDIIAVARTNISEDITCGELKQVLCDLSKPLLLSVLERFEKEIPTAKPQDVALVTYASKIEPEEGRIDWNQSAQSLHDLIRAFSPQPGARCFIRLGGEEKQLKILRSQVIFKKGQPGEILSSEPIVACKEMSLQLLEVQPEGKKKMLASDWFRGLRSSPQFL